jgi:hypothetical protein
MAARHSAFVLTTGRLAANAEPLVTPATSAKAARAPEILVILLKTPPWVQAMPTRRLTAAISVKHRRTAPVKEQTCTYRVDVSYRALPSLVEQLISRYLKITMAEKLARGDGSPPTKNMVLRLDPELAERLAGIAEVEGRSVSDVAREAIAALVEARRKDKRFRRLLEDSLARHQRLLDLLRGDEQ